MLRNEVLKELEQSRGKAVSGAALAQKLGVSRTAVWKAVHILKEQGVEILSHEGKGYTLSLLDDSLTTAALEACLKTSYLGRSSVVLQSLPSTNTYLKELAQKGAPHGTVVLADTQSGGRGRMGRAFFSPASLGLYMSVLLRPSGFFPSTSLITAACAVAVADAVEETAGISPDIKWVNDLQLSGKKLCGILTEASIEGESGVLQYAVCGLGINITAPAAGYSQDLGGIATALSEHISPTPLRAALAASILFHLETRYHQLAGSHASSVVEDYRNKLSTLGRRVEVFHPRERYLARAVDITEDIHLVVERANGTRSILSAGEISVKG